MMNKKAFEIQFNWLFVLIAGASILLFFTVIVVKQKSVSETSTKATVLKSIEAIISGASVSTDTTNIVNIPESSIEVGCGRISLGGVSNQYQNLVLFAPSLIKGNRLATQTLAFSAPYRAVNLLYITSPQLRYIIIGDTSLARSINKTMPSSLKKEFYQVEPKIANTNNYKTRFVIFGNMIGFPKSLEKMPDLDVTAIKVDGDDEKGTIEFYQKNGGKWLSNDVSSYIGKASLIAAVYADSKEAYECNMQNVFSRLNIVTKVHMDKANELLNRASSKGLFQCVQIYNSALQHLQSIYLASSGFSKESVDTIAGAAKSLAAENQNAQVYSCPLIY